MVERQGRALWWLAPGRAGLRAEALPVREAGDCVVRALWSGVSVGTERLVAGGRVPELLHDQMRCPHMAGAFTFPIKYGYSLVGEVVEGPEGWAGRRVHLLHPHQDRCVVPVEALTPLPDGLPGPRATLASNMETALTALWDAGLVAGERAAVVGFGGIGALIARLVAATPGAQVVVLEPAPERLALARDMGFEAQPPEALEPGTFDVAFHTSASSSGLQVALDAVGPEGRAVELSWFGERAATVSLGTTFHSHRKRLLCSQVSNLPSHMRPRWDYARRKAVVLALLADPAFDRHLGAEVPFEALPTWIEGALAGQAPSLSPVVVYP